jgi:hypothetical protein
MSGTTDKFEGGCLCGAVRFIATGQPKAVYWCHCQSCRRHSGAPGLPTETHFYVGAFDRAAELQPTRQVFREEHLPWFPIAD